MRETPFLKAAIFDAYGTLFDVHAPIETVASRLGADAKAVSALWRRKQIEYTWLRSLMGRYEDFAQITADALDYAFASYNIDNASLREELLVLYQTLKPYPDAVSCLATLKEARLRTGILSNGSSAMLSAAVNSAKLGAYLDYVLSVDTVQIYKPNPLVYNLAVEALGVEANEIAFVSANGWDCAGASAFGFQVIHVNRSNNADERLGANPAAQVSDLNAAAAAVLKFASV